MTPLAPAVSSSNFQDLQLNPNLLVTIQKVGYTAPTPIQLQAIPPIVAGHDVVGLAQTGTGKTAAFALPIIHRLLAQEPGTPRVLVMVPTRELAEQVCSTFKTLTQGTRLRTMTMYGGVRIGSQARALQGDMDIIVGCPGRILDHIEQRTFDPSTIETLVLDECDQMFDMGFIVTIRKIIRTLPKKRQNLLFSATMPEEIRVLTKETLHLPVQVQVAPVSAPDTITHVAYPVAQHLKPAFLREILARFATESVLVFTRTKHKARKIAQLLEKGGVKATSLQGNLSQNQRMEAMKGFRSGKYSVMVATDIASRGLDISSVSHVINFDLPETTEAYLHRTGRTGRAARTGDALSFISPDEESQLKRVEKVLKMAIPRKQLDGFDYLQKTAKAAPAQRAARSEEQGASAEHAVSAESHDGERSENRRRPQGRGGRFGGNRFGGGRGRGQGSRGPRSSDRSDRGGRFRSDRQGQGHSGFERQESNGQSAEGRSFDRQSSDGARSSEGRRFERRGEGRGSFGGRSRDGGSSERSYGRSGSYRPRSDRQQGFDRQGFDRGGSNSGERRDQSAQGQEGFSPEGRNQSNYDRRSSSPGTDGQGRSGSRSGGFGRNNRASGGRSGGRFGGRSGGRSSNGRSGGGGSGNSRFGGGRSSSSRFRSGQDRPRDGNE